MPALGLRGQRGHPQERATLEEERVEVLNETLTRKKWRKAGGEVEGGKQRGEEVPRPDERSQARGEISAGSAQCCSRKQKGDMGWFAQAACLELLEGLDSCHGSRACGRAPAIQALILGAFLGSRWSVF